MNYAKVSSVEAIALIIVVILNRIVLNLPKSLIDSCGSSTPLNVIYIAILGFIISFFVIKLFKNFSNSDIVDVSEYLGGKILKNIIGICFIVYFIVFSGTLLRNFSENIKLIYFPETPVFILVLLFLIVAVIANKLGPSTVTRTNIIVVPLVMVNLIVAYFAVSKRFVPERIFPILGYGINETFFSNLTNLSAFTGLAYVYFILPMLKKKEKFKPICFISLGISTVYLLLSVTCLLFSFADILNVNEMSAIYLLIRGTNWGKFIQKPDAIFFFGWILCLMSYLSINIMFISRISKKIGNLNAKSPLIYLIAGLIFIMALIPTNLVQIRFIQDTVFKYLTLIFLYGICILVLIFANIKYRKKHKISVKEDNLENAY